MAQGILVFIEQRNGNIRKASLEALSEAVRQSSGEPVSAVVIGANVKALSEQIKQYKPGKILVVDGADFAAYSTEGYAAALTAAIKKEQPRYLFAATTSMAKDLIPRVAARLDGACVTDVVELRKDGQNLVPVRSLYSGKAYGAFNLAGPLALLMLRPNIFAIATPEPGHNATIEDLAVTPDKVRARVVETHVSAGQKVELSEASIIVSGGRGIKGPENWPMLQSLCDVLGAALGASRAVVDAGWIDHQHQVGQTGKTVSPQLYIAVGISGAIQHLAGMSSSKIIVAINKDPEAPIFKHATYGLVGDVFEIVPKLTEELKKALNN